MRVEWNDRGFQAEMNERQQNNIPTGMKRCFKNSLFYGLPAVIIGFFALLFIYTVHFYADMLEGVLQNIPKNLFFAFYLADYVGCFISAIFASLAMVFSINVFRSSDEGTRIYKNLNTAGFICAILALCTDIACIVCTTCFLIA